MAGTIPGAAPPGSDRATVEGGLTPKRAAAGDGAANGVSASATSLTHHEVPAVNAQEPTPTGQLAKQSMPGNQAVPAAAEPRSPTSRRR